MQPTPQPVLGISWAGAAAALHRPPTTLPPRNHPICSRAAKRSAAPRPLARLLRLRPCPPTCNRKEHLHGGRRGGQPTLLATDLPSASTDLLPSAAHGCNTSAGSGPSKLLMPQARLASLDCGEVPDREASRLPHTASSSMTPQQHRHQALPRQAEDDRPSACTRGVEHRRLGHGEGSTEIARRSRRGGTSLSALSICSDADESRQSG